MSTVTIYTTLPPVGGNATITLGLAQFLIKKNFGVNIIVKGIANKPINQSLINFLEKIGCKIIIINSLSSNTISLLYNTIKVARVLSGDFFISIGMGYMAPILALLGGSRSKYFYYINHDPKVTALRRLKYIISFFDLIIVISPTSLGLIKKNVNKTIRTIWLPQFSELEVNNSKLILEKSNKFKFGFIGNLIESKGILELLKIWPSLPNNYELKILGDGDLIQQVEKCAKEHININYSGSFAANERNTILAKFLRDIDYILVPSIGHGEGIPTVILEALSLGVPVISSNGGGTIAFEEPLLHEDFSQYVKLIKVSEFANVLLNLTKPSEESRSGIINAYKKWFSNSALEHKWLGILT